MLLLLFLQDFHESFIEILIALEKGFDFLDFFFGQWFLFNQAPNNLGIRENEHHDFWEKFSWDLKLVLFCSCQMKNGI